MTDMELKEINKVLRDKAIAAGLCEDWQKNVWNRDLTIPELLHIYIKGFDFSVKQEWFDYDFIKEAFPIEELHKAGIYMDEEVDLTAERSGYFVFLGDCHGSLQVDGFLAVAVYVRHRCRIDVCATGGAKVFVIYHDESDGRCYSKNFGLLRRYNRR